MSGPAWDYFVHEQIASLQWMADWRWWAWVLLCSLGAQFLVWREERLYRRRDHEETDTRG